MVLTLATTKEQCMSISPVGGLAAAATAINALVQQESAAVRQAPNQYARAAGTGPKAVTPPSTSASVDASSDGAGHIDVTV
jgi:hypothetical protein